MRDPYEILGVTRTASEAEIKSAYRRLAKELHPDLHPDKKGIEEKFKEVSAAYSLLSDADKRQKFDAGEIDAFGAEQAPRGFYRDFGDSREGAKYAAQEGFSSEAEMEDFLSGLFRGAKPGSRASDFKMRGADVSYSVRVSFLEAAGGAEKSLVMPGGKVLKVHIPAGATDRMTLRLAGQGNPGYGEGASAGDAYIEIHIEPHAYFNRKDSDIHVDVPVTLGEAVLGGKIEVPTIDGPVTMTVPKGSNSGTVLRLKNKGVKDRASGLRGHQYVKLQLVLPDTPDPALESLVAGWQPPKNYHPRQNMGEKG